MALLPVAEALSRILARAEPLSSESVELSHAAGRTLAEPVVATSDNPPFASSAMDGYAVRATDTLKSPANLHVIGEAGAGRPFARDVHEGEAVRIFTGGSVPDGADAVVIQEDVSADGAQIKLGAPVSAGANVRPRGEDFRQGDVLIASGRRLSARDVLLIGAAGHGTVSVARKPTVAILSTGDELVEPGSPLKPGQISASNAFGLAAVVALAGGEARSLGIARDTHAALEQALKGAEGADVLVTIGGASVGDHDLVRPALEKAGVSLDFYKIAMRPGKPLFFGVRPIGGRSQYCLGLPGNPVSAMICARVFLVPLLAHLVGRTAGFAPIDAILTKPLAANGPREHYMRATLDTSCSPPRVSPFDNQDSGLITTLQRADCLLIHPVGAPAQPAGAVVRVVTLDI
jgi:molybdopterin molybdotransferase